MSTQNLVKLQLFGLFSLVGLKTGENKSAIGVRSFDLFQMQFHMFSDRNK